MPKISKKDVENSTVLTTKKVEEIMEKENLGVPLHRTEKLWFKNIPGVRKAGLTFAMTDEEVEEYAKAKLSIHYFAENFVKIKLEDGRMVTQVLMDEGHAVDYYGGSKEELLEQHMKNRAFLIAGGIVTLPE